MIDLALLGLLADQPRHGYELRKQLAELLGARGALSFGSLYPALNRLERRGLVEGRDREPAGAALPPSGSLTGELAAFRARRAASGGGGRARKVFAITEAGRAELAALLAAVDTDDRTFAVQVAFCRHLTPTARLELFEGRRSELAARAAKRVPATGIDRYLRSLRDRDSLSLTHDLAWLDDLIAAERAELPPEDTNP